MTTIHSTLRPLAFIVGTPRCINFELARHCALNGFDLLVAVDHPSQVAEDFRMLSATVRELEVDLLAARDVQPLDQTLRDRDVDALLAIVRLSPELGEEVLHPMKDLIRPIAQRMVARGQGRILIAAWIDGLVGSARPVRCNDGLKAIHRFARTLRDELGNSGVTVTEWVPCLTATPHFQDIDLDDPGLGSQYVGINWTEVAEFGFKAMLDGATDALVPSTRLTTDTVRSAHRSAQRLPVSA